MHLRTLANSALILVLGNALSALCDPSPATVSLQARKVLRGTSGPARRALPQESEPLKELFLGTDLQWYGNLSIGTPPQVLPILFDTGSFTLEFASTRCTDRCANQLKFNESKSSTFVDTGHTDFISFATSIGVDPVINQNYVFEIQSANDTVAFGHLKAKNIPLYLISDQSSTFSIDPFSGILGLGAKAQGFFGALVAQGLPSLFSFYLTPKAVGNAEIILGGIDKSKYTGQLVYTSLASNTSDVWFIDSPRIFVNGKTSPLLSTKRSPIFDSGTSNILFSTNTTEAMYALISPDIKPNPDEPGSYGIACDRISSLPATIDFQFTSQSGSPFNLTIPSSELNVGPFAKKPELCQTLISAIDINGIEFLGASLLKHYYSVWDVGGKRMGFAPAVGV